MKIALSSAWLAAGLMLAALPGAQARAFAPSPVIHLAAAGDDTGEGASSSRTRMTTNSRTGGVHMGRARHGYRHHRHHRHHYRHHRRHHR